MTITETDEAHELRLKITETVLALGRLQHWVDAHPDVEVCASSITGSFYVGSYTKPDTAGIVRALKDGAPLGSIAKRPIEGTGSLMVARDFGGGIVLAHYADRGQVCERVVTGVETVEVPDPDAPKITVEREIIEWRCAPILGDVA